MRAMHTVVRGRLATLRKRVQLATAVGMVVLTMTQTGVASAMSPPQTTPEGLVRNLAGGAKGGIEEFWRYAFSSWGAEYVTPTIYWYNRWDGDDLQTACGSTAGSHNNAFHCLDDSDHGTYLDYRYMQTLIRQFGDYGAGGILAHEWGHAIQHLLGYAQAGYKSEYHADCLAGMYTRYGYMTGRLNGSDYGEFSKWLATRTYSSSHGWPENRAAWYKIGYTDYSLGSCNRALTA